MPQSDQIAEQASGLRMEQYLAFSRECRKTIGEEIRLGEYPYLCSNTLRHKSYPLSVRARVNIIGRPAEFERTGKRALHVGGSEVVFIIQKPFKAVHDYKAGFSVSESGSLLRIVAGSTFASNTLIERTNVDLLGIISADISARRGEVSAVLGNGDYACFVKLALCITNQAVGQLVSGFQQYTS